MVPYVRMEDIIKRDSAKVGYTLLDERQGCVNGCRCGVSIYRYREYGKANAHEDQEGFLVLEGRGRAMIADEELLLEPGMCFMIPAGVFHTMKCDSGSEYCKVFWFHGAV